MFSGASESAVYNLKLQTRCLAWVPVDEESESDKQHLLVGTTCLREENEIHLLEYTQSSNSLVKSKVFNHAGEIWALAPCPRDADLLATCYNTGTAFKATVWRVPGLSKLADSGSGSSGSDDSEDVGEGGGAGAAGAGAGAGAGAAMVDPASLSMAEVATLPDAETPVVSVTWSPHSKGSLLGVYEGSLHSLTLSGDTLKDTASLKLGGGGQKARKAAWDPLHSREAVAAVGTGFVGVDLRSMTETVTVPEAHKHCVRDVHYNPNKPRFVATCGDDGMAKFWDLRRASEPVKILSGHSHWAWRVAYNRFHDQLVLSSSSDTLVSLWRVSSISSAPLLELDESSGEKSAADALVKQFEEHQDSVYGLDWSYNSAWVFASLSFSGRVAVSHVPPPEMYKILL